MNAVSIMEVTYLLLGLRGISILGGYISLLGHRLDDLTNTDFLIILETEVHDQGVAGLVSPEVSILGFQIVTFLLCHHVALSLCVDNPWYLS